MSTIMGKNPLLPNNPLQLRNLVNTQIPELVLRNTQTYSSQVQNNPAILVKDASAYSDQNYVQAIASMYLALAKTTLIPIEQIRRVNISDMEIAFAKLAKEQKTEYKEMCKFWGIIPEEHHSKKRTLGIKPANHLRRLCSWGYFELFFPEMEEITKKVALKTTSTRDMSDEEKAKYAYIFTMFICGQCFMPYDVAQCKAVYDKMCEYGEKVDLYDLKETVFAAAMEIENEAKWNASMLNYLYNAYLKDLPDGAISIDMVIYFLDLIDYDHKLLIKEFVDLLSAGSDTFSEKSDFKAMHLSPLRTNLDIRILKEKIFPLGPWVSEGNLFLTTLNRKQTTAYRYAYNRFKKYNFVFGEGIETVMKPEECRHAYSHEVYTKYGYLYAWSPLAVRVSDPNELWMMRYM